MLELFAQSSTIKDIEHILKVIDGLIGFNSDQLIQAALSQMPVGLSIPSKLSQREMLEYGLKWPDIIAVAKQLKNTIVDEVYREYAFRPKTIQDCQNAYERLFMIVRDFIGQNLDIITVNYDRVIEEVCASLIEVSLIDGFTSKKGTAIRQWDPRVFNSSEAVLSGSASKLALRLYKLHGSLDWRIAYDKKINSVGVEGKCDGTGRYTENLLIYPTEECPKGEHYDTLLKGFANSLRKATVVIVIGYSFRDASINVKLVEFVKQDPARRLIVISPDASKDVHYQFGARTLSSQTDKRILRVNREFPTDDMFDGLIEALQYIRLR